MQTLQILIPRLRKALAQLPYLPQTLSLVWTAARRQIQHSGPNAHDAIW
jgi:hypothetical protein